MSEKAFAIEGELVGGIRFCGTDEEKYMELETYRSKSGVYYNVRYRETGSKRYSIEIKESKSPMIQGHKLLGEALTIPY